MPHMVIFRDAEGRPGYHQAEALDDAVRFVEELRNERQVTETRVFAMQEIPLEFKTYWRVEITPPAEPAAAVAVATEPVAEAEPEPEFVPAPAPAFVPAAVVVATPEGTDDESMLERVPFAPHAPIAPAESTNSHSRFGLFGR